MSSNNQSPAQDLPKQARQPDFLDLTVQDQTRILQQQQDIVSRVAQGHDAISICEQICWFGELLMSNSAASIMLFDEAGQVLNVFAAPSVPDEVVRLLNGLRHGPGAGSCGNAVYRQQCGTRSARPAVGGAKYGTSIKTASISRSGSTSTSSMTRTAISRIIWAYSAIFRKSSALTTSSGNKRTSIM